MERELASKAKHDPKLIHTYIRKKMDVKEQIRAINDDDGRLTVDISEIFNILSNQFEAVFVKDLLEPLPEFKVELV